MDMKNSDQEFKDWLMRYRGELPKKCQQNVVDDAIKAMDGDRPFAWWLEEEYYRLRMELMGGFPFASHLDQINLSRQGTVVHVIKSRWDSIVKNRVAEMNPPSKAGTPNP